MDGWTDGRSDRQTRWMGGVGLITAGYRMLPHATPRCARYLYRSILLKEPFALKNSETVYFTSIFSTPSYSDIAPIDNFDLTFFYFYFVFEVFDAIQF